MHLQQRGAQRLVDLGLEFTVAALQTLKALLKLPQHPAHHATLGCTGRCLPRHVRTRARIFLPEWDQGVDIGSLTCTRVRARKRVGALHCVAQREWHLQPRVIEVKAHICTGHACGERLGP